MKRIFVYLVLLSTALFGAQQIALAGAVTQSPAPAVNNIEEWRYEECRFESLRRASWTVYEIKLTMQCAIEKWSVEGGFDKALDVAHCESGPDLRDPKDPGPGGYVGTFQQAERYWRSRRETYNPKRWEHPLARSGNNPRSNVVVSIRMAHAFGWNEHWAGCA